MSPEVLPESPTDTQASPLRMGDLIDEDNLTRPSSRPRRGALSYEEARANQASGRAYRHRASRAKKMAPKRRVA